MQNGKTLSERLSKYKPDNGKAARIIESAGAYEIRADRERRMLEITADFPAVIPKRDLYAIEEGIAAAYELTYVRLKPRYPADAFTRPYIAEILTEAKRGGAVSNGFFHEYELEWHEDEDGVDDAVTFYIPFSESGVGLLDLAGTARALSDIIYSEFGRRIDVTIKQSEDWREYIEQYEDEREKYLNDINDKIIAAEREREAAEADKYAAEDADKPQLEHVATLLPDIEPFERFDDGTVRCGLIRFDASSPKIISGAEFDMSSPTPLRLVDRAMKNIVVFGVVFEVTDKETRSGDKINLSIGISDGDASVYMRTTLSPEAADELMNAMKPGKAFAIRGDTKFDNFAQKKNPDAEPELTLRYLDIAEIKRIRRLDITEENTPESKRIELHIHTQMSAMDATIPPEALVETAQRFGHRAIAVTDHGNLQAFPIVMEAAEKAKMNVIYGLEAYYVDDTARAVYGSARPAFADEFCVFDIETTGFSALNSAITEIGAVIVKDGEVLDRFNTFADPGAPIPRNITELTGITDDMVAGAPSQIDAVKAFLEFAGDRLLIAHNANFDIGFIRATAEKNHIRFDPTYLDTVAMSRYVNPELQNHKLDTLADYFGLGDFNHHRASDDAAMLAAIFKCMTDKLEKEGVRDIESMLSAMSEHADPLKLPTYHMIIFVRNMVGLKNLYKLVSESYLKYYRKNPRIPKTVLDGYRDGLIIGSACESGELYRAVLESKTQEELEKIARYYDYLEIQPCCNNEFLIRSGKVADEDGIRDINRRIYELGKKVGRPVVATTDSHFLDPEDEIFRKILLAGMKFKDADYDTHLYLRTTNEMLDEFSYLGADAAREVVVTNPHKIADMIDFEHVRPIPRGNYPPHIDGSEEELTNICHSTAKSIYGDPLPPIVSERLEKELSSIIKNGFAVLYIIAKKLVENSESKGYLVGSRGSVGSSFVATMAGITRVDPLPPHYICKNCKHSEFITDGSVGSGFDLPPKDCPNCHTPMYRDGHDIPFETFLGFYGEKSPDIDLNFSGDVQADAHKFTEELFGTGNAFRAGTIGALAPKTAYGFSARYLEDRGLSVSKAHLAYLMSGCVGVKRTTGQHPGGIIVVPREYDVYDFTPIQHPADDPDSGVITTHFAFKYLHDTILKLDILGHDIPTKYKRLEEYTGVKVLDVPMTDKKVFELFTSVKPLGLSEPVNGVETGTLGLPEMGTRLVRSVLMTAKPKNFADLLQISGLTHGTGVWNGNADELIKSGTATISEVIGTRDDIMLRLIADGLDKPVAFKIMEFVRKNKKGLPIPNDMIEAMKACDVPQWYIDSLQKIRYMFPKAHAAAYVMDAIALAWYKIYYPVEFYAAYFTAAPDGFDAEIVMRGPGYVREKIGELNKLGADASQKDAATLDALMLASEYYARGYTFLPIDIKASAAHAFLPEKGAIRLPFASLPGLGDTAAEKIVAAREAGEIYSVEDLRQKAQLSKTVIDVLERNGILKDLSETNQLTLGLKQSSPRTEEKSASQKAKTAKKVVDEGESMQISLFG